MSSADTLPDDIEALKGLLRQRDAQLEHMQDLLVSRDAVIATGKAEIEHLKLLIAKLRRMQFGRKAEKLDRQIAYFGERDRRFRERDRFGGIGRCAMSIVDFLVSSGRVRAPGRCILGMLF